MTEPKTNWQGQMRLALRMSIGNHQYVAFAASWIATRATLLAMYASIERSLSSDVLYYHRELTTGAIDLMPLREYPIPVTWVAQLPLLSSPDSVHYVVSFAVMMLTLDALFSCALIRRTKDDRHRGIWIWLGTTTLLGPVIYARLDLAPSVLAGLAIVFLNRRFAGGTLLALGASLKVWPAGLLLALWLEPRKLKGNIGAFLGTLILVAGTVAQAAGVPRLLSPYSNQGARGLQIESVAATVPLLLRLVDPDSSGIRIAYGAVELTGPNSEAWLYASQLLLGLALSIGVALGALVAWRGNLTLEGGYYLSFAAVALIITTSRVFSPQYLVWLAAVVAATYPNSVADSQETRAKCRTLAFSLASAAALTHIFYPTSYVALINWPNSIRGASATIALAARNILILASGILASLWAVTSLLRPPRPKRCTLARPTDEAGYS